MNYNEWQTPFSSESIAISRGRGLKMTHRPLCRSMSLECPPKTTEASGDGGILPSEICPADEKFLATRLNDITSYFFLWFCKKYRIRIGPPRDLEGQGVVQTKCPICLDACTKSVELQCGHSFCRSCLTRSAANNMTSCALCRREQEINPKLLRARFDEKRMLNLAQRLAIPPPVRSRPPTPAAPVSPTEGIREEKEEQRRVGTSSTALAREMLGRGGDVGAMSADDLRRRWKFNGLQAAVTSGPTTVGAVPTAELRASWRTLEDTSNSSMYIKDGRDAYAGAGSLSCSTDAEVCAIWSRLPVAKLDSSFAGGNSPDELTLRWTRLPRIPPNTSSVNHEPFLYGDSHDAAAMGSSASSEDALLFERTEVGDLGVSQLRRRWHKATEVSDVGGMEPRDLSFRLFHALGGVGDTGGLDAACLRTRLCEAVEASDAGGMELRDLYPRLTHALDGADDIGGSDTHYLRERWHSGSHVNNVEQMEIRNLPIGLRRALGGEEDVGGLDTSCLRKRWHNATVTSDVGELEVRELVLRLTQALHDGSAGEITAAELERRWSTACEEQTGDVRHDGNVEGLLFGKQNAHATVAHSDAASKSSSLHGQVVSLHEQAVGAVSPGALLSRWCGAGHKSAPVG